MADGMKTGITSDKVASVMKPRTKVNVGVLMKEMGDARDAWVLAESNQNYQDAYNSRKRYNSLAGLAEATGVMDKLRTSAKTLSQYDPEAAQFAGSFIPSTVERRVRQFNSNPNAYDDRGTTHFWQGRGASANFANFMATYNSPGGFGDDKEQASRGSRAMELVRQYGGNVVRAEQAFFNRKVGEGAYDDIINMQYLPIDGGESKEAMEKGERVGVAHTITDFQIASGFTAPQSGRVFSTVRNAFVAGTGKVAADMSKDDVKSVTYSAVPVMETLAKASQTPGMQSAIEAAFDQRSGLKIKDDVLRNGNALVAKIHDAYTKAKPGISFVDNQLRAGAIDEPTAARRKAEILESQSTDLFDPSAEVAQNKDASDVNDIQAHVPAENVAAVIEAWDKNAPSATGATLSLYASLAKSPQGMELLRESFVKAGVPEANVAQAMALIPSIGKLSADKSTRFDAAMGKVYTEGVQSPRDAANVLAQLDSYQKTLEAEAAGGAVGADTGAAWQAAIDEVKRVKLGLVATVQDSLAAAQLVPKAQGRRRLDTVIETHLRVNKGLRRGTAPYQNAFEKAARSNLAAVNELGEDLTGPEFKAAGQGGGFATGRYVIMSGKTIPSASGAKGASLSQLMPAEIVNRSYGSEAEAKQAVTAFLVDSGLAAPNITDKGEVEYRLVPNAAAAAAGLRKEVGSDLDSTESLNAMFRRISPTQQHYENWVRTQEADTKTYEEQSAARQAFTQFGRLGIDLSDRSVLSNVKGKAKQKTDSSGWMLYKLSPAAQKRYFDLQNRQAEYRQELSVLSAKQSFSREMQREKEAGLASRSQLARDYEVLSAVIKASADEDSQIDPQLMSQIQPILDRAAPKKNQPEPAE